MDGSIEFVGPGEPLRATYQPGETLYSPEDRTGRTFTVESGAIDILSTDGGDDPLIATYYRGSTFGYPDGVDHSRLPAVARARERSVVLIQTAEPPPPPAPKKPAPPPKVRSRDLLRRDVLYPGDTLFREGDQGDTAFIIESGAVEVFRTEQGKEIRLGMVGPGSILGEMALIDDQPRMATARAVSQSVAVTVGRRAFESKVNASDPFIRKLLRILVRYIRLHADYFVRAQSELHDTYLLLGLDPDDPDTDRLHEILWQAQQAERQAQAAAGAEPEPAAGASQARPAAKTRKKKPVRK